MLSQIAKSLLEIMPPLRGNHARKMNPGGFRGDEFARCMPEKGRSRPICSAHHGLANDGREPKLTVSVGVATYPKDGAKVDSL